MLNNINLRMKIIGGFIIVAIITMVVGVIGWNGVKSVSEDMKHISMDDLPDTENLLTTLRVMGEVDSAENFLLIPEITSSQVQEQYDRIAEAYKQGAAARQAYELTSPTKQEKVLYDAYITAREKWKNTDNRFIELAKQYQATKSPELRSEMVKLALVTQGDNFKAAEIALKELIKYKKEIVSENVRHSDSQAGFYTTASLVSAVMGLLTSLVLGIFLGFSITKPLQVATDSMRESAQQVASASEQLSASSQQLAESNSEQAAAIEQTSSTLEESASMLQQSAENTRQALQLSGLAKEAADKGNLEMKEMIASIDEIKESSDKIAKIIKVIDEIAFQTNILALNAAVEAARAGEAGMGFAVVAEEVRNLAQRSAQAAKDTETIIESNIVLSARGVDVSRKVAESLSVITVQSQKVNELMDEITAASLEQTQGINQINKAMSQMEKATQQNAATAEESAAASEQLSAQAQTVNEVVQDIVELIHGNNDQASKRSQPIQKYTYKKSIPKFNPLASKRMSTPTIDPNDVIPLDRDRDGF